MEAPNRPPGSLVGESVSLKAPYLFEHGLEMWIFPQNPADSAKSIHHVGLLGVNVGTIHDDGEQDFD